MLANALAQKMSIGIIEYPKNTKAMKKREDVLFISYFRTNTFMLSYVFVGTISHICTTVRIVTATNTSTFNRNR